jgi:hypothetical protein
MKFIELTRSSSQTLTKDNYSPVLINPMMITALVDLGPVDQVFNTHVYTMGGSHVVKETIEQIQKLIQKSENTTTVTWKTSPTPHI